MSLSQRLQQKLLQKLSPQQIQLMKLLQVPTAHLEERIKEELEENPALETGEDGHDENFDQPKDEFETPEDDFEKDGSEEDYDKIDISEYVNESDDEVGDYKLRDDNYGDPEETKTVKRLIDALRQMRRDGLIDSEAFDETETVPEPTITALAASGWLGLTIPREFGGLGLSPAAYARVFGEVSRMDASLAVLIGVHCGLGSGQPTRAISTT